MQNDLICELAVKKTLAYSAIFNYPISFYRLQTLLITDSVVSQQEVSFSVNSLVSSKVVTKENERFLLNRRRAVDWASRKKESKDLLSRNQPVFKALEFIPWLRFLGVTGTVACENAEKKDDIDIFIITSKKRLWITRFFVVLILKILNSYRTDENPSGKICPNLFVTEDNVVWDKKERSVFVAHEILMMRPIVDKDSCYFKFIHENSWVFDFFSNARGFYLCREFIQESVSDAEKLKNRSLFMDFVEKAFEKVQLFYMRSKKTTEITTSTRIHFRRSDNSEKILRKYQKINSQLTKH